MLPSAQAAPHAKTAPSFYPEACRPALPPVLVVKEQGRPPYYEVIRDPLLRYMVRRLRLLWALGHAEALMSWDLETHMPREGIRDRSAALEEITALMHSIATSSWLREMVEAAQERLEELNDYERGLVRVVAREVRIATALPEDLVRREAKLTAEATKVWEVARKRSDFNMFKPYLEQIVEIQREKAEKLGYEDHPYDALLDLYEEGLRTRHVEEIFSKLVPATRRVLDEVRRRGFYPEKHPLEEKEYDVDKAREMVRRLLGLLRFPLGDRGRVDESAHPFTIDMGVYDVRITVRYEGRDFKRFVYSAVHEFGHALYELQQDPRLDQTPLAGGVSLGVHESQSRFWENIVGRGPWFMAELKRLADETIGLTRGLDLLELYRYVNTVRPDVIRVDADEVTYNLHIYLRFVLEKKLIEGSLRVDELPEAWNSMMEELLGVRPRNDAEGVLQDIHWSHGSIGYFPTYTLGNVVAAMIWRSLGGPEAEMLQRLDIPGLQEWLREKIHIWGKTYPPRTLVEKALGSPPAADALIEYLEWKYTRLPDRVEELLNPRR